MSLVKMWNNTKIVHKLYGSFTIIILLVVGMVIFSSFGMNSLKNIFGEYRGTARESLIVSNLLENFLQARVGIVYYRLPGSGEKTEGVYNNLAKIDEISTEADQIIEEEDRKEKLHTLQAKSHEYEANFTQMTEWQQKRHAEVAEMSKIGSLMRQNTTDVMRSAYEDGDSTAAYFAGILQEKLMLARYYVEEYLMANKEEDMNRVMTEIASAKEAQEKLLSEIQNRERRRLTTEVGKELETYKTHFEKTVEAITQRNANFATMAAMGPEIMGGYHDIFKDIEERQNTLGPEAARNISSVTVTSIVVGLCVGVISVLFSFFMGRMISTNIGLAINQMQRLSKGDKSFEIEGAERGDEIGDISKALQVFRQNAMEVDRLQEEQKQAEKKQAEERKKAMMQMADEFDSRVGSIVDSVEAAAQEMQSLATQLASAVEETTNQSSSVAAASEEASTNVQTVASAAEELSISIKEISKNVADTADTAKQCASAAHMSQERLDELQGAINEIDSVIQAINDVAEQTNLLALNATIEAARAGDAGKGFAVVANEVKTLANQTHKMTDEIAQKVIMVKNSAKSTIETINDILGQIESLDGKTANVASAVEQQSSSTNEISRNVQEAASGTEEVSRNVSGIQQAANDSAKSTETLKGSSTNLAKQAKDLSSAVDSFLAEIRAG